MELTKVTYLKSISQILKKFKFQTKIVVEIFKPVTQLM